MTVGLVKVTRDVPSDYPTCLYFPLAKAWYMYASLDNVRKGIMDAQNAHSHQIHSQTPSSQHSGV